MKGHLFRTANIQNGLYHKLYLYDFFPNILLSNHGRVGELMNIGVGERI
jgi:hypothetical protein